MKLSVAFPAGNPPGRDRRFRPPRPKRQGTPQRRTDLTYIRYTPAAEAGPRLSALYDRYADARGRVDNILRIHSLNPPSMQHHYELYRHLMSGPSPLSRVRREMIAVTVSAENDCFY